MGRSNDQDALAPGLCCFLKPFVLLILVILCCGAGAGLLSYSLDLPNLLGSIKDLRNQVDRLGVENDRYYQLNEDLNGTVQELQVVNVELEQATDRLNVSVYELNTTVAVLNVVNKNLTLQNNRYSQLNDELMTVASFLNETAENLDKSYEELTAVLSEQIVTYRVLALQTLQNTYLDRTLFWDCSFRDVFRAEPYVLEEDLPIEQASEVNRVIEFVDDRVLSELCLSRSDFESFQRTMYSGLWTANDLFQGVSLYTAEALKFYFPDRGEAGLTVEDWAQAAYQCENLDKSFEYSP